MVTWRALVLSQVVLVTAATCGCTRAQSELSGECPPEPKSCGGRCVAVDDPAYGCGEDTCAPCSFPQGVAVCASGACTLAACAAGFGDCDLAPANGCESPVDTAERCGACDVACALDHAEPACVDAACAIASCEDGFGDCDGIVDNGCEADLSASETCGSCDLDCLGGDCSLDGSVASCGDVKIYGGPDAEPVFGVAVDETHVYFTTEGGALLRIPKGVDLVDPLGPEVETIVATGVSFDVAVDETHVYWTTIVPSLLRAPKRPGADPEVVQSSFSIDDLPVGLARRQEFLYWGNLVVTAQAGVWRVPLLDLPSMPASQAYVTACGAECERTADVDLGGDYVCWTQLGGLPRVLCRAQSGGDIFSRAEDEPRFLAMDGDRVYWTSSVSSGALRTAIAPGLQVDGELITGLNEPMGVAYDETALYVGELGGRSIRRLAKAPAR